MEKFIPYEKLSKKEKRKMDLAKRQTWGELNPVTRKPQNSKAYNRKRTQEWRKELPNLRPYLSALAFQPFFQWFADRWGYIGGNLIQSIEAQIFHFSHLAS